MSSLLQLEQVQIAGSHRDRLSNLSLRIHSGERVALLGPSGAGKSSLMSVINGTLIPQQGRVLWRGQNLHQRNRRQRCEIGTLWQDLRLIEELSVGQNINAGALGRYGLPWALANLLFSIGAESCLQCLRQAGLDPQVLGPEGLDRPVQRLSGGQRQRVALARLFRQRPSLVLADEPLASLDPAIAAEVLDCLLDKDFDGSLVHGADAVMVSLHRPDLIHRFDRVLALREGRLLFDAPATAVTPADLQGLYAL